MQCDVTRCAICIPNKAEYLDIKERSYKNSTKEIIVISSDLCNATKKILDIYIFSFHSHFKTTRSYCQYKVCSSFEKKF